MVRLTSIIANNNYVARVGKVGENAPNVKCLVLTNNRIATLGEVDNMALFKRLEHLSLLDNPINMKQNYRYYVIHMIPSLKTLDYKKISKKEKTETVTFFKSSAGKLFIASVLNEKNAQADVLSGKAAAAPALTLSDEQKAMVRSAIENAKTREEIDIIEKHLKVRVLYLKTRICTNRLMYTVSHTHTFMIV
jgi:U2 small nuclear ribonucleoprotein A'